MDWLLTRRTRAFPLVLMTVALLGTVTGCATNGAPSDKPNQHLNVLTAREIRLVDDEGNTRAHLAVSSEGAASLVLLSQDEDPRAELVVEADGRTMLQLRDKDQPRVALLQRPSGDPGLFFKAPDGTQSVLGLHGDGQPGLVLADEEGVPLLYFLMEDKPQPGLVLADQDGRILWFAPWKDLPTTK